MLSRIVVRSFARGYRRKLLSVVAVTLGITAATAVGNVSLEVGDRVSRELRSFGANILVTSAAEGLSAPVGGEDYRPAGAGTFLAEADLVKLKKIFWRNNIMAFAPWLDFAASVDGRRALLAGTWFDKPLQVDKNEIVRTGVRHLHPGWKVLGDWPDDRDATACLVGRRLAERLGAAKPGRSIEVRLGPRMGRFRVVGLLETGGPEDEQVLAPLATVQAMAGLEARVRRVEVSALTKPEDAFARSDVTRLTPEEFDRWFCTPYVSSIAYQIQQAIPGAEARPVFQVSETEGRILNQVGILVWLLAAAALVVCALAVTSMTLATVLQRRAEIGLYKSLGATDARVAGVFLFESAVIGLAGGVFGFLAGSLAARRLSLSVFGLPTGMHWTAFPGAVVLALLVTIAGSAWPLGQALRISPVAALRNE
ncbi:MAG TPA: ABC transporter permease [Terriglobia bacterium]|nr:ABC transporter permease [Terriglobia bacterium]